MLESELTWRRALKIWWLMLWRSTLMIVPASFAAGATVGALLALSGLRVSEHPFAFQSAGFAAGSLVSFPIAVLVIRMAVRKKYQDFRLAVLPPDSPKL